MESYSQGTLPHQAGTTFLKHAHEGTHTHAHPPPRPNCPITRAFPSEVQGVSQGERDLCLSPGLAESADGVMGRRLKGRRVFSDVRTGAHCG